MQASFGVIQINVHDNIKALVATNSTDVRKYFYKTRRDTLCRQMGYTEAVVDSVYTVTALEDLNFTDAKRYSYTVQSLPTDVTKKQVICYYNCN